MSARRRTDVHAARVPVGEFPLVDSLNRWTHERDQTGRHQTVSRAVASP